jgi:S1-C subfamily serine protease
MKLKLFPIIYFLLFLAMPVGAQNRIADVGDSVVRIIVSSDGKTFDLIGTGFFVSDGWNGYRVVSASHVYFSAHLKQVEEHGGRIYATKTSRDGKSFSVPIDIVDYNIKHDSALFKFDPKLITKTWPDFKIKPLQLSDESLEIGNDVFYFGYLPGDEYPVALRGIVSGFDSDRNILFDMPVQAGQSGGPLVSVQMGRVVGVVIGTVPITISPGTVISAGISKATRIEYTKKLIDSNVPQ